MVDATCTVCKKIYRTEQWRLNQGQKICSRACVYKKQIGDSNQRFWSKVDKNGPVKQPELGPCWIWTAAIQTNGYGVFRGESGKTVRAHKYIYQKIHGLVSRKLDVCHSCDNRSCVRDAHMFVGTRLDNMRDAQQKGRALGRRAKEGMLIVEYRDEKITLTALCRREHIPYEKTRSRIRDRGWTVEKAVTTAQEEGQGAGQH